MKTRTAVVLLGLWTLLSATACAQNKSLGGVARESAGSKSVETPCPPQKACERSQMPTPTLAGQVLEDEQQYRAQIQPLIEESRFDSLDKAANRVRTSKERVTGGTWKLYLLYDVVSQPITGNRATEREWTDRLA